MNATYTEKQQNDIGAKTKKMGVFIFTLCLFITLLLVCSSVASASSDIVLEQATVNNPNPKDRLNLRTENKESATSLGRYYNGVVVEVLEYTINDWVKVRIGGNGQYAYGYMMAKYLAFGTAGSNVKSAMPVYETTGTSLHLKASQSTTSDTILAVGVGVKVELLGFADSWWHVRVDSDTGYVPANTSGLKLVSGNPNFGSAGNSGNYYDGYRIAIVNNPNPTDRLNLRKSASSNADTLGKYYNGTVVALLSEVKNGWAKVKIGNLEGYMESKYLSVDAQIGSVASAMPTVTVSNANGKRLNLREKQSDKSNSLGLYNNGTQVQVLGLSETWYHVQVDGKVGFMMAGYMTPKLQYHITTGGSGGSGSTGGSGNTSGGSSSGGAWSGPTGSHKIAQWPIPIIEYVGIVNNPVATDRLHLRTEPKESAPSLGKYYNGVQLIINSDHGDWTYVAVGNLYGYMKTEFLSISQAVAPASAMPIMTVSNPNAAGNLHLREKQSTNSKSLGLYDNGTQVILMGFNDEWAHVIVDGQTGFMLGKYLK